MSNCQQGFLRNQTSSGSVGVSRRRRSGSSPDAKPSHNVLLLTLLPQRLILHACLFTPHALNSILLNESRLHPPLWLLSSSADTLCRRPSMDERKKKTLRYFLLSPALAARHWLARSASGESYGTYSTLIPERDSSGSARLALVISSHSTSGADSV